MTQFLNIFFYFFHTEDCGNDLQGHRGCFPYFSRFRIRFLVSFPVPQSELDCVVQKFSQFAFIGAIVCVYTVYTL